ncbi:MAG: hypothetical protein QOK19_11 [Solirubrobacteraceae bacterium]|nr:hypothetical protein [Solirubrobacterales bacterium]MEA2214450.1 hypothetical protein [Solirubrobacteraceae bacterium]
MKSLSPEKDDMPCPKRTTGQIDPQGVVVSMLDHPGAQRRREDRPLSCVSSGYMSGGCSCPHTIPAGVVEAAWSAELARTACGSSFFHLRWRGQVWLAFGLDDGQIRGVYCPTHRAERDARSVGCEAQHYSSATAS